MGAGPAHHAFGDARSRRGPGPGRPGGRAGRAPGAGAPGAGGGAAAAAAADGARRSSASRKNCSASCRWCCRRRPEKERIGWTRQSCGRCRRRSRSATRRPRSRRSSPCVPRASSPDGLACKVDTGRALVEAGLHPATGGSGLQACSGDMLLEALAACAGVTLNAVSTALGIQVRSGKVKAEGDLDFRGTLGVAKDAPVGFRDDPARLRARHRRRCRAAGLAHQAHRALLRGAPDAAHAARNLRLDQAGGLGAGPPYAAPSRHAHILQQGTWETHVIHARRMGNAAHHP